MNLIHSPGEPQVEAATVDLYLRRKVRRVSASAFMGLTPTVVRYALSDVRRDSASGQIVRANRIFAKISRAEIARSFMLPAPPEMLQALVAQGALTLDEAEIGRHLPIAEDITVEADSGGHTDNRPLTVLLPTILNLRAEILASCKYPAPIRIGAAGGLGVPSAVAAAFSLGASYVLTGTVNQSSMEAGTSMEVKKALAQAGMADVHMAPAADMFELGVKVQVLKRGTLFGLRAQRLYEIYSSYGSLEDIPRDIRTKLESEIFRETLDQTWERTQTYWMARDPEQVEIADRDPRHRMALCFRAYLGEASRWARQGNPERRLDYQVWCGPAMGAFNAWVKGSFLEAPENRTVVQIGRNLLEGAAVVTRAQQLRSYGVPVPPECFDFRPRPLQ
jgi:PfaD family protein